MFKFLILFLPLILLAEPKQADFNSEEYKQFLEAPLKNAQKIKDEFGYLQYNKKDDSLKEELEARIKMMGYKEYYKFIEDNYKDTIYLTKKELLFLVDDVVKRLEKLENLPHRFLFVFTTEGISKKYVSDLLLGVSILQDNGYNFETKQYHIGIPKDMRSYLNGWKSYIETYPIKYQSNIARNFKMKFDPGFFKMYNVDKAPAMAVAVCASATPTPENCRVQYLIRGEVDLITFFDKISKKNTAYLKYKKLLEANKIYKPVEVKK